MSYEILIILFILLSVISSIINKLQESRRKQLEREESPIQRVPSRRSPPVYRADEEEIDLSEWEVLPELERRRTEPVEEEFQEVRGTRHVEETDTGREFQEVQATPPASETAPSRPIPSEPGLPQKEMRRHPHRVRRRRKIRLNFKQDTVRQAILYNEIIGPPRSDRMPW